MEIFLHHGIPRLMNFNRLIKFGFIFESNTPQKTHQREALAARGPPTYELGRYIIKSKKRYV